MTKLKYLCVSIILFFIMIISQFPLEVSAQQESWSDSGNYSTEWFDSTKNEFYINSPQELAGLSVLVSGGESFSRKTITLNNDIDLDGKRWEPIGNILMTKRFKGTFDGNNFTINNMNIVKNSMNQGLFGCIENAVIKNLNIINMYIESDKNIGGICGYCINSTIFNCIVHGTIVTNKSVSGGIVGYNLSQKGKSVIKDCFSSVVMTNSNTSGGITGSNASLQGGLTEISVCCSVSEITGTLVGGITGVSNNSVSIKDCCYLDADDKLEAVGQNPGINEDITELSDLEGLTDTEFYDSLTRLKALLLNKNNESITENTILTTVSPEETTLLTTPLTTFDTTTAPMTITSTENTVPVDTTLPPDTTIMTETTVSAQTTTFPQTTALIPTQTSSETTAPTVTTTPHIATTVPFTEIQTSETSVSETELRYKNAIEDIYNFKDTNIKADDGILTGEIISALAGKNVNLTVDIGDGITWTINGKDINTHIVYKDMDLSIEVGEVTANSIRNKDIIDDYKFVEQLDIAFSGKFPFKASISIPIGKLFKGYKADLYYINEETRKLELIGTVEISENGRAVFEFTHASSYVIAMKKENRLKDLSAGEGKFEGTSNLK